jgi:SAM-dependent methyltransferase
MNPNLQKIFSRLYSPTQTNGNLAGASSVLGTQQLRDGIIDLFEKYKIASIFDAGCNDCNWIKIINQFVQYHGGDISLAMVADAWQRHPELDVVLHDVTTDPIPKVDLLFVRDVAIHLNNHDRQQLWLNWYRSSVPWILITHQSLVDQNTDIKYSEQNFPFSAVNWQSAPWNFPAPLDQVTDKDANNMSLWHRSQFENIL